MQSTLWTSQRSDETVHWSRRDQISMPMVMVWVGGVVATALTMFGLGVIGH